MKFYFLASFIILLLVFGRILKKTSFKMQQEKQDFWAKENAANSVRKKPLDNLDYIAIPLEELPITLHNHLPDIQECVNTLQSLSQCKIVNLTGISNTDLKLAYGTANITVLSEYDQNYTLLVTTLQKWAEALYALGEIEATKTILEYSIEIHCDISKTYLLLAEIYAGKQETLLIKELMNKAKTLSSLSSKTIVRRLTEAYPELVEHSIE